jgi:hypothetical protein
MTAQQEGTPREKFLAFTKKVVSVPKSEIDKREREYQRRRKRKKK